MPLRQPHQRRTLVGGSLCGLLLLALGVAQVPEAQLQLFAAQRQLPANTIQDVSLLALLTDQAGRPLAGREVSISIVSGAGTLAAPPPGDDALVALLDRRALPLRLRRAGQGLTVTATPVGPGLYAARFLAAASPGETVLEATALDGTAAPTTAQARIVTSAISQLAVRIADPTLALPAQESTTVLAYVFDDRGRPLPNRNVQFNVVNGTGRIVRVGPQARGRYAAVYQAGQTGGTETVRVTVVDGEVRLAQTLQVQVFAGAALEALALPELVEALPLGAQLGPEQRSTLLISVRDQRGLPVTGLGPDELSAQVMSGPGAVSAVSEVDQELDLPLASGLYRATFTADNRLGRSLIQFVDLQAPERPRTTVEVETRQDVGEVNGVAQGLRSAVFGRTPLPANGRSTNLVAVFPINNDGLPVSASDRTLEARVVRGGGEVSRPMPLPGSGLWFAPYRAPARALAQTAELQFTFFQLGGPTLVDSVFIPYVPHLGPQVVVFPATLPALTDLTAVVDVYDFDADTHRLEEFGDRYLLDIASGVGTILRQPADDGHDPDLIAGDHVHSGLYRIALPQRTQVSFQLTDRLFPGLPSATASLLAEDATTLEALLSPPRLVRGQPAALVIAATDQLRQPFIGLDLLVQVVSGDAQVVGGQAFDHGAPIRELRDAYANDGVYLAELIPGRRLRAGDVVQLQIIDRTTPGGQPLDLSLSVE
ncbi:MAG: hypothetical protein HY335_03155 [Deinococcus sp.]|nr:hypothetical protein [Deinococcus sp.]